MEKKALLDAQPADSKGWPQRVITSLERRLQQLRLAPPFGLGKRADDHTTQRFYRLLSSLFLFLSSASPVARTRLFRTGIRRLASAILFTHFRLLRCCFLFPLFLLF